MDAVLSHLAGASVAWLAAGVVLHLLGQFARGVAWRAALAPLTPDRAPAPCRRRVPATWVAGAGLTGVLSSRGGDAVRVALVRRLLPGVPWPALAGTIAVEGAFETVTGIALAMWVAGRGFEGDDGGGALVPLVVGGVLVALAVAPPTRRWLRARGREAASGLALLRDPRRYARALLPLGALSRALRLAALACFLVAFALPAGLAAVACLAAAQGSGRLLPAPGAAAGASGGVLLVAFGPVTGAAVDPAALAALAIGMPALLTAVGLALSLVLGLWVLGTPSPRRAWRELRQRPAPAPA